MKLFGNYNIKNNELYLNNIRISEIGKDLGTPIYIYDEELIRSTIKRFKSSFEEEKNIVTYAGKAFLIPYMCTILNEEGMYLDVVSGGELYIAKHSGFPMDRIFFHGNNKSVEEILMGIQYNVGRFVVDNFRELEIINKIAIEKNKTVKVLIRIAPGIEAHTHEYIKTGSLDTKFGFTLKEKEYMKAVKKSLEYKGIEFLGIHCHIGSQICETKPYEDLSHIMVDIAKEIYDNFNINIKELDIGGGFGVYYNDENTPKEIEEYTDVILKSIKNRCSDLDLPIPVLIIEPGRSIVANSGITIYKVGAIKNIPNIRKYVAVDGGMGDNIRPALYEAIYESVLVNRIEDKYTEDVRVCGKYCESGDILLKNVTLPTLKEGDIIGLLSTGAYGYSMSSNYNMSLTPGVVFISKDNMKLVCKRQTYEDLVRNFII